MQLQTKLAMMKGKSFLYKSQEHTIINFKIIDETVHIVTDSDWIEIPVSSAETILSRNFHPVEGEIKPENPSSSLTIYQEIKKANLTTMLVQSLDSVKAGTMNIKTAKSMSDTVRTILEIAKTEILVRKNNGKR